MRTVEIRAKSENNYRAMMEKHEGEREGVGEWGRVRHTYIRDMDSTVQGLEQRSMLIQNLPSHSQERHQESGDLLSSSVLWSKLQYFEPQHLHLQMRGSGPDDYFLFSC